MRARLRAFGSRRRGRLGAHPRVTLVTSKDRVRRLGRELRCERAVIRHSTAESVRSRCLISGISPGHADLAQPRVRLKPLGATSSPGSRRHESARRVDDLSEQRLGCRSRDRPRVDQRPHQSVVSARRRRSAWCRPRGRTECRWMFDRARRGSESPLTCSRRPRREGTQRGQILPTTSGVSPTVAVLAVSAGRPNTSQGPKSTSIAAAPKRFRFQAA